MKDTFRKTNRSALLILLLAWMIPVVFCCTKYGKTLLDADMASEMVLAKQLNEEGTILSTNWLYPSEIRILAQEFFFKIGLFFFPDRWDIVRVLTQAFLLLGVAFSYLFMTAVLPDRRKNIYFAAMLLCPFGFWQMFHNIFDGFYLLHMIFYMLCAGLIFRICLEKERIVVRTLLLGFLCFEQGLEGVRLLMNLFVPMILAAVLFFYLKMREFNGIFKKEQMQREMRLAAVSVYSLILGAAGYLVNLLVLSKHYQFMTQSKIMLTKFSLSRILEVFSSFMRIFGYPIEDFSVNQAQLLSVTGLFVPCSLLLMAVVFLSFMRTAKRLPSLSLEERLVVITCWASTLVTMMIFSITDYTYNGSYFLPFLPSVIALLSVEWKTESFRLKFGRSLAAWVLAAAVIGCSLSSVYSFIQYPPRAKKDINKITRSILKKGYTQGVSTFWYGNAITELSNGQIEMWTIENYETMQLNEYLQPADHLTELPEDRGVFVIDPELYYAYFVHVPSAEIVYDQFEMMVVGVENMQSAYLGLKQMNGL